MRLTPKIDPATTEFPGTGARQALRRARPAFLVLLLAACQSVAVEPQLEVVPAPRPVEVVESEVDVHDLPAVAPLAGSLF